MRLRPFSHDRQPVVPYRLWLRVGSGETGRPQPCMGTTQGAASAGFRRILEAAVGWRSRGREGAIGCKRAPHPMWQGQQPSAAGYCEPKFTTRETRVLSMIFKHARTYWTNTS